jgi:hypothetical protein
MPGASELPGGLRMTARIDHRTGRAVVLFLCERHEALFRAPRGVGPDWRPRCPMCDKKKEAK